MSTVVIARLRPRWLVAIVALLAGFVSVTATSGPANAHADVVLTSPEANTQVASPSVIAVGFIEPIVLEYSSVTLLTYPEGSPVTLDAPTLDPTGTSLEARVPATLAPRMYQVVWHNLSVDGHESDGSFKFEVTDNGTGPDVTTPSPEVTTVVVTPTATPSTSHSPVPISENSGSPTTSGPTNSGIFLVQIIGWGALGLGVLAGIAALIVVFLRRRKVD